MCIRDRAYPLLEGGIISGPLNLNRVRLSQIAPTQECSNLWSGSKGGLYKKTIGKVSSVLYLNRSLIKYEYSATNRVVSGAYNTRLHTDPLSVNLIELYSESFLLCKPFRSPNDCCKAFRTNGELTARTL